NPVDNYRTSYSEDTFTITNTLLIDINVNKIWVDENNQDGIRPDYIDAGLYIVNDENNWVDTFKQITLNDENNWCGTINNLDKYDENGLLRYSFNDTAEGYTSSCDFDADKNAYILTNEHIPYQRNIKVAKIWNDDNTENRQSEITVNLYSVENDIQSDVLCTLTLSDENDWHDEFENLPVYKNGTKIQYIIAEENVDGYAACYSGNMEDGFIITNTELIDIPVKKVWIDSENQDGIRPDEIEVSLLADNEIVSAQIITADDEWTYTFKGYPKYDRNMNIIEYSVTENPINNYTTEYSVEDGVYIITNTHDIMTLNINVEKIWLDDNNQNSRPDTITIKLYADNSYTNKTLQLSAEKNWSGEFTDLDMYSSGRKIVYTIDEISVDGYISTITGDYQNGFIISNSYIIPEETTAITEETTTEETTAITIPEISATTETTITTISETSATTETTAITIPEITDTTETTATTVPETTDITETTATTIPETSATTETTVTTVPETTDTTETTATTVPETTDTAETTATTIPETTDTTETTATTVPETTDITETT
ncbi:MAG: Cna B-type domain-containing protein, partial [Oscillospiraceae bacterium]